MSFTPGWILPDETVQQALEAELQALSAAISGGTIDAHLALALANLAAEKRDRLKAFLTEQTVPVRIGYPRDPAELPCFAIVIDPEEEQEFVGETGVRFVGEDDTAQATEASAWLSTIGVLVYAEHGELVRWLYQLAKFAIARRRQSFSAQGVLECHLSGRDFGFDPRFMQGGRFVYRRALQVRLRYLQHDLRPLEEEITAVDAPGTGHVGTSIGTFTLPA